MTTTSLDPDLSGLLALDPAAQDLLFRQARTPNTFTDEPVTDEQLAAVHDLAQWAPTSMNTQPLRITLVRSAAARARLLTHLMPGNQAKTATAPVVAVLTADTAFHEHLPRTFPHLPDAKDLFADEALRERTADLNATLQMAYFILAVRAAGLAAGPMTGLDTDGLQREFFAGTSQRVLAVVNIGRPGPDAWYPRSPRLGFDEVVTTI